MKLEKPPVLSDEEKLTCSLVNSRHSYKELKTAIDEACIHQRDADVAYYEPIIKQLNHQRNLLATALLNILRKCGTLNNDTEPNGAELIMFAENFCEHNPIQQAKAEVIEDFQKAIIAIRDIKEEKELNLSDRAFEVFFSIRNDGLAEGYGIGKAEVARSLFDEVICPMCYRLNPHHADENNGKGCSTCQEKESWCQNEQ